MKPRKLQKIGSSLFMSIPFEYCNNLNLTKGSVCNITITEEGNLLLKPKQNEETQ